MRSTPDLPSNIGKRALFVVCAMAAFYAVPVSVLALIYAALQLTERGPAALLDALKVLPLVTVGGATAYFAVRLRQDLKADEARAMDDARRSSVRVKARSAAIGTSAASTARVAAPLDPPRIAPFDPLTEAARKIAGARDLSPAERVETVRCTWCGERVKIELADPESGDATCPSCSTSFSVREQVQTRMGSLPEPIGLKVERFGDMLVIQHLNNPGAGCGLVVVAFIVLLLTIPDALNRQQWAPTVYAALATVALLVITRIWAARATEYTLDDGRLTVKIHGFPARTVGEWNEHDVDQVFLRERVRTHTTRHHRKKNVWGNAKKITRTTRTWDVILRQNDEREVRLAKDLPDMRWGLYIEQEIENRLHIIDRKMGKGPSRQNAF